MKLDRQLASMSRLPSRQHSESLSYTKRSRWAKSRISRRRDDLHRPRGGIPNHEYISRSRGGRWRLRSRMFPVPREQQSIAKRMQWGDTNVAIFKLQIDVWSPNRQREICFWNVIDSFFLSFWWLSLLFQVTGAMFPADSSDSEIFREWVSRVW